MSTWWKPTRAGFPSQPAVLTRSPVRTPSMKSRAKRRVGALEEILRVLRPKGAFLMMEHDVPSNLFLRALFYVRLTVAGAGRAVAFLRREREVLEGYFGSVEKALSAGRAVQDPNLLEMRSRLRACCALRASETDRASCESRVGDATTFAT